MDTRETLKYSHDRVNPSVFPEGAPTLFARADPAATGVVCACLARGGRPHGRDALDFVPGTRRSRGGIREYIGVALADPAMLTVGSLFDRTRAATGIPGISRSAFGGSKPWIGLDGKQPLVIRTGNLLAEYRDAAAISMPGSGQAITVKIPCAMWSEHSCRLTIGHFRLTSRFTGPN